MKRIFKRKIYSRMLEWKEKRSSRSALLIKGARRVGKSTIAHYFAENEYESFIEIDFSRTRPEILALFDDMWDLDMFFFRLQQFAGVRLINRKSVIVFDEIQNCPKARQAIKHLVADGRYDYIETGSLISIYKNVKDIIIPSEEWRLNMYPLDFFEFLSAIGRPDPSEWLEKVVNGEIELSDVENRAMMRDFRLYMLIGGMPQAINAYLDTNNLQEVDNAKREIIELYINDFIKIDATGRASRIFSTLPGEMSRSKTRYEVGSVIANAEPSRFDSVWFDLEESMTVNFCYRCCDPNVGMGLHKDSSSFKIYMGDTGLLVTLAFWDKEATDNVIYNKLLSDKISVDLGYIYENAVAQILRSAGDSLYYYTFPAPNNHVYEIDFLLSRGNKLIPIEVKSSGYKAHKSLDVFCDKYSERILFPALIYTKTFRREGNMIMAPAYMASLIK